MAARIRAHRTAEVHLTVADAAGRPLAHAPVTVRMTRHKFLFGAQAFYLDPGDKGALQRAYQAAFTDLFNFATLGFYWGSYAPAPGETREAALRAQAAWLRERGLVVKGHPLSWNRIPPRWLPEDPAEAWRRQLERCTREARAFAGVIDMWDVINEAVHWPKQEERWPNGLTYSGKARGAAPLVVEAFAATRAGNPRGILLINETASVCLHQPKEYEDLIDASLKQGTAIDAIGIQCHMLGANWTARQTWDILARFGRFGKPLHFTELSVLSGPQKDVKTLRWQGPAYTDWLSTPEGEQLQARYLADWVSWVFSRSQTEAITFWSFSDHRAWLGMPAGILNADMTPKPAHHALRKLIKETWWTPERKLTTDAEGRVRFRAFLGDHEVEQGGQRVPFLVGTAGEARPGVVVPQR